MAHSSEAALVFPITRPAAETLAYAPHWDAGDNFRRRGRDKMAILSPHGAMMHRAADDKLIGLISHWLFHCRYRNPSGTTGGAIGGGLSRNLIGHLSGYRWQC